MTHTYQSPWLWSETVPHHAYIRISSLAMHAIHSMDSMDNSRVMFYHILSIGAQDHPDASALDISMPVMQQTCDFITESMIARDHRKLLRELATKFTGIAAFFLFHLLNFLTCSHLFHLCCESFDLQWHYAFRSFRPSSILIMFSEPRTHALGC
jgi:hypothetical protein